MKLMEFFMPVRGGAFLPSRSYLTNDAVKLARVHIDTQLHVHMSHTDNLYQLHLRDLDGPVFSLELLNAEKLQREVGWLPKQIVVRPSRRT